MYYITSGSCAHAPLSSYLLFWHLKIASYIVAAAAAGAGGVLYTYIYTEKQTVLGYRV